MKIIGSDNHARDTIADILHSEGYSNDDAGKKQAQDICDKLNAGLDDCVGTYYHIVDDDYRLWNGWKDLV